MERLVESIKHYAGKPGEIISLGFPENFGGNKYVFTKLEDLDEQLWDRVIRLFGNESSIPMMKAQGKGKIVNVTSVAARTGGGPGSIAYSTAKAGVSNLTRALAKELVGYNILVNGIAPGVISTPFHDRFSPPEIRQKNASLIPLGREGTPDEAAGAILFLSSSFADYITGEIIEVNGGQLMD
ncbi:SDR family oxidoreductase [Paenibacillus filicis]|uniref:SDR family oxidoreductase n=1 Tax=Paenibacillus gyeongsangnamensis TaxID=3388067 RepID=A0ABT4QKE4_9BACL|nr:SDR family oxidoreductase [Paenibacillus filicis]MCZ8517331.1 SDR family oxidoreductase [Paenibacillus filicis]